MAQFDTTDNNTRIIQFYEPQKKIYPKKTKGRYSNIRLLLVILTQAFFFLVPWLNLNNRQAFLFDIMEQKFYIFNMIIWPQDLLYLTGILICSALGLFWWTAIAGRIWCGYACPQTVYTQIMIWFDRLFEGDRAQQIKWAKAPLGIQKIVRKTLKLTTIVFFCFWVGFTFVGFFTPIRTLFQNLLHFNLSLMQIGWLVSYGFFTFLFAYVLREQVCRHMCPYARFQSAMFDVDTLIVCYDEKRGEPRGARKKGSNVQAQNKGACIDCTLCVQVCPAGIDIRDGLQYECIGCAVCIDVCNEVMDKMNYPRGLIRYTTEAALKNEHHDAYFAKRLLRPKVTGYGMILLTVLGLMVFAVINRIPYKVDVVKDPSVVVRENNQGWAENTYVLKFMNTSEQAQSFDIKVSGFDQISLEGAPDEIIVPSGQHFSFPVRVATPWENATAGKHDIVFEFTTTKGSQPIVLQQKTSFIGAEPF